MSKLITFGLSVPEIIGMDKFSGFTTVILELNNIPITYLWKIIKLKDVSISLANKNKVLS